MPIKALLLDQENYMLYVHKYSDSKQSFSFLKKSQVINVSAGEAGYCGRINILNHRLASVLIKAYEPKSKFRD